MARNPNSNISGNLPIDLYADAGTLSTTYTFSSLTPTIEQNVAYRNTIPTAYDNVITGESYGAIDITGGLGESLFVASDGGSASELRGWFNAAEIVAPSTAVPEPAQLS